MAEKNGSSLLERREGSDYQFPSLLTVDKLVVMFLFSGASAVVLLLNVPAASFVHFLIRFYPLSLSIAKFCGTFDAAAQLVKSITISHSDCCGAANVFERRDAGAFSDVRLHPRYPLRSRWPKLAPHGHAGDLHQLSTL